MDFIDMVKKQEKTREFAVDPNSSRGIKKQKIGNEGTPFYETIATSLFEIWKTIRNDVNTNKSIEISKVEIEIRVGHILSESRRWKSQSSKKQICCISDSQRSELGLNFKSGVDEIYVEHLKRILTSDSFHIEQKPSERLRFSPDGVRWQVDTNGNVLMAESKTKIIKYDLALLSHQYDIRINAATENPQSRMSVQNPDKWTLERYKKRKTLKPKGQDYASWRIDMTEVDIKDRINATNSVREMELEFEMDNKCMQNWLIENDENKAIKSTGKLASELFHLLNLCIPGEIETVGEAPLEVVTSDKCSQEIIRINEKLKKELNHSSRGNNLEFLGCMPINLSRRNLLNVQRNDYYITEKSDGTRYLLYVVDNLK